jgi:hypothetical protein
VSEKNCRIGGQIIFLIWIFFVEFCARKISIECVEFFFEFFNGIYEAKKKWEFLGGRWLKAAGIFKKKKSKKKIKKWKIERFFDNSAHSGNFRGFQSKSAVFYAIFIQIWLFLSIVADNKVKNKF